MRNSPANTKVSEKGGGVFANQKNQKFPSSILPMNNTVLLLLNCCLYHSIILLSDKNDQNIKVVYEIYTINVIHLLCKCSVFPDFSEKNNIPFSMNTRLKCFVNIILLHSVKASLAKLPAITHDCTAF